MAHQSFELEGVGTVTITRSRRSRNIRMSVSHSGVRVSIPLWVPYATGRQYAQTHKAWILRHQPEPRLLVEDGQRIGKYHTIVFTAGRELKTRVNKTQIIVTHTADSSPQDAMVQAAASKAIERALKREAERLIGQRVQSLSESYQLPYASVSYKKLKRRWGSCDSKKQLVFNIFLVELPWEMIDYVITHELAHTIEMNHGDAFWKLCEALLPGSKDRKRRLKTFDPIIGAQKNARAS